MNVLTKMHRRLQSLDFERDYAKANENFDRVREIEAEMREIDRWFEDFYSDPMLDSISL